VRKVPNPDDTLIDMPPITDPPPTIPRGIVHWHGQVTGSWWAMIPATTGRGWSRPSPIAVTVDWHLRHLV